MGKVTVLMMDAATEQSGHQCVPNAVSVCITPCAPSPVPIPYPVIGQIGEGITDPPMRTKFGGVPLATTGSVLKACHGNEAGTLKEVVSLNTGGPCFVIMGAPTVLCELGMVGMTGSLCISNKAITVGAGANASDASGSGDAGNGAGSDGSGDGNDKKAESPKGGGGGGSDDTATGASSDASKPKTPPKEDEYCPDKNKKAPPPFEKHIEDMDLRNHRQSVNKKGSKSGKEAAKAAMFGKPGGHSKDGKGQAFWSGGGQAMEAARTHDEKFTIQEDKGGAKKLDKMNQGLVDDEKAGGANGEDWSTEHGKGSKVTRERLWKTISRRSAENAKGSVDAFVVGKAHAGNVFSKVELPTLLHNENCTEINFRDPTAPPPAPVVTSWKRQPNGCWKGPPVPPGPVPAPGSKFAQTQGFQLHPEKGIHRFP